MNDCSRHGFLYCKDVVIIHEVYPDGAAAKDGRLRSGDQLVEVNGEDFRSITHTKALGVLRQTPAKVCISLCARINTGNRLGLRSIFACDLRCNHYT